MPNYVHRVYSFQQLLMSDCASKKHLKIKYFETQRYFFHFDVTGFTHHLSLHRFLIGEYLLLLSLSVASIQYYFSLDK